MKHYISTKKGLYLFTCLSIICTFGCQKDWLDQKPISNLSTPTSLQDYQAMLESEIMYYSPLTYGDISSDGHRPTDALFAAMPGFKRNAFTWSHDRPNTSVLFWDNPYRAIIITNLVLEGLPGITVKDSASLEQYNQIKGAALFQRARIFFELAQIWAPIYNQISAATDLSIPLKLSSDVNNPTIRSTVDQTYKQVIKDLNSALPLLPNLPTFKNRPSKVAVYGELARVYLSMSNYTTAGKYADSCLGMYSILIDYNTLSTSASFIGAFNAEVIFHSSQGEVSSFPAKDIIDTSLLNLYSANDLRKVIFFKSSGANKVFKGNYFNNANSLFNGLATDEVYLIRAECEARIGNIAGAMTDINTLLQNRWRANTFIPFSDSTASDALNLIFTERKKELLFRGQRWTDLRRLNLDPAYAINLTHTAGGQTWQLSPGAYQYTFAIPDDVMQFSGIKQNPGW